jgi:transcriptional regulator GlxA family with amidase domain
LQIALAL